MQFRGAKQRSDDQYELGLFVAWHMALFSRAKTLPEWASVIRKFRAAAKGPVKQTPTEQRAMLQHLSEVYGIPLRVNGRLVSQPAADKAGGRRPRKGTRVDG